MDTKLKKIQRDRRRKRIRAKIFGTPETPRLSVFKSNKYIYAQLIDDKSGKTIASVSSKGISGKNVKERATAVGVSIGEVAISKNIKEAVFDRGGYVYKGSIELLANGARSAGLKF